MICSVQGMWGAFCKDVLHHTAMISCCPPTPLYKVCTMLYCAVLCLDAAHLTICNCSFSCCQRCSIHFLPTLGFPESDDVLHTVFYRQHQQSCGKLQQRAWVSWLISPARRLYGRLWFKLQVMLFALHPDAPCWTCVAYIADLLYICGSMMQNHLPDLVCV